MLEHVAIIFCVVAILVVIWLYQPYKSWKQNFTSRKSQAISIHTIQGSVYSLSEYLQNRPDNIYLSIVVPSYNEQERIALMLKDVKKYTTKNDKMKYEIIVVNDGSKDNTSKVALQCGKQMKLDLVVVEYPKNRGKGGAVRAGMAVAKGKYVLFADADGATTFGDIDKLFAKSKKIEQEKGHPLVMVYGSRRHLEQDVKVQRKWHRQFVSWFFKQIITILMGIKASDTQCGFKLFTSQSKKLFQTLHLQKFAFDVELFFLCSKFGIVYEDVAVQWKDVDGSKLNVLDASVNMLRDVLMVRFCYLLGLWKCGDKVKVI